MGFNSGFKGLMCQVFFVQYSDCWKLHALIIISIYSTLEVIGLVAGVQNMTLRTLSSILAGVAYFRT